MPFPMRIQPIDYNRESPIQNDTVAKPPVMKSRLKRLFDRPFMRISSSDKLVTEEFEPSSMCLDKMVRNFIEESNVDKQSAKLCRNRCNCFNGNSNDSSDDEFGFFSESLTANSSFTDPSDALTSLIPCASVAERNLLADTSKIVESNKNCKGKDDMRNVVTNNLITLGYNASICKSKWEKSSSIPAGEYEYIDVIIEGERLLIDVDFRSEFEIARSTSSYKAILQLLPIIFVGKSDRLLQIVLIASEAVRQSLRKKGMHIAPWRKFEYMKSKWLSPHTRRLNDVLHEDLNSEVIEVLDSEIGELDLIFGEKDSDFEESNKSTAEFSGDLTPVVLWQLPAVKPKSLVRVNRNAGLASLLKEEL